MPSPIICIVAIAALSLHLVSAQLNCTLAFDPEHPELINATITNTHSGNISVLAWNNIFDTEHNNSRTFTLKDAINGSSLPAAGMHLNHLSMTNTDLLDLWPGASFTRQFNLLDYIGPNWATAGQATNMSIDVSLPPTFRGLKDHNGTYRVNPLAAGVFTEQLSQAGNLSSANLTDITMSCSPLRVNLHLPALPGLRRRGDVYGVVNTGDCGSPYSNSINYSLVDANNLALAGFDVATHDPSDIPFSYFFNANDAGTVSRVLSDVSDSILHGFGPRINAQCTDWAQVCSSTVGGYAFSPSWFQILIGFQWYPIIVMCPAGLGLPRNAEPCSAQPNDPLGSVTLGHVMLHEITHIQGLVGIDIGDINYGAVNCHDLVTGSSKGQPTRNADCYAFLGNWAWSLGLAGVPYTGPICQADFDPANTKVAALPAEPTDAPGYGWRHK